MIQEDSVILIAQLNKLVIFKTQFHFYFEECMGYIIYSQMYIFETLLSYL
jgi:hypothetical protein